MVAYNKRPVSCTLRGLYSSAQRSLFFVNAFLRSPFFVNSLALLTCELTLQRSLSSLRAHTQSCPFECKKAEKHSYLPNR